MKIKIFTLAILSILSMIILVSGVSAAITLSPTSYTASINKGASGSFNFNIYNDGTSPGFNYTLVNITSNVSNLIGSAGTILSSQVSVGTLPTSIANQTNSSNIGVTITIPSTQANGTYTGTITIGGINNETSTAVTSKTIALTITVTQPQTFCTYDSGVSANNGELYINIKDITVTEGLGDDEEWGLLDEVEVEIEVENKGDYDIDDISLEWGIADDDMSEWIIEMDEEDEFNLKDGDEDTYLITFKIDEKDLDVDFDELNTNYKIFARITGTVDGGSYDGNQSCAYDSADVKILTDSDFLTLYQITSPALASCGEDVQITADIWNIGDNDQEDVYVKIFNLELGINQRIDIGDVDAFDKEILSTNIQIPEGATEKLYNIRFDIYDEDDDIFESDEFDEEATFFVTLTVQGNCASSVGSATVSASLDSEAKAGQPLIVRTTISNSGTASATYTINSAGYASWANSATVDIPTFTIGAGESKQVAITLGVKEDASGEQTFNIEVLSGGQLIKTQPVAVTIAGKSAFSSITGGAIGGNGLIWGIGIINVILIVVIIIVAVKVARN